MDKIRSLDELREAQSASAANGASIPNYNDWNNILSEFEEQGIQSTGTYEGDVALKNEMQTKVMDAFEESQKIAEKEAEKEQDDKDKKVGATENVTKLTDSDSDQNLKATFANATSSTIAADYMKYFHQL